MNEQPKQKTPEQEQIIPIPEAPNTETVEADQPAVQAIVEVPGEVMSAPVEQEKTHGFFRRRFNALRNAWHRAKEAKTTEVLVKKPSRLIGEVALIGVWGSLYAGKATYEAIGRGVDKFAANIESQEQDRLDGYDSYTLKSRVKSKVTGKPLNLRPPKPPSVLDSFKNSSKKLR